MTNINYDDGDDNDDDGNAYMKYKRSWRSEYRGSIFDDEYDDNDYDDGDDTKDLHEGQTQLKRWIQRVQLSKVHSCRYNSGTWSGDDQHDDDGGPDHDDGHGDGDDDDDVEDDNDK